MKYEPQEITNPFMPTVKLLPPYDEIPEEFKTHSLSNKWVKLFNDWFFGGLKSLKMTPRDGIDVEKARKHIHIAMTGFDSKHEHKEAGVAYLLSLWFEDPKWERKNK